jgi:hypothetical protein
VYVAKLIGCSQDLADVGEHIVCGGYKCSALRERAILQVARDVRDQRCRLVAVQCSAAVLQSWLRRMSCSRGSFGNREVDSDALSAPPTCCPHVVPFVLILGAGGGDSLSC